MRWTADGSRLVTGDVQGTLAVWTAEGGLHPALVAQYKEPGAHVDHVLIAPLSSAPPEVTLPPFRHLCSLSLSPRPLPPRSLHPSSPRPPPCSGRPSQFMEDGAGQDAPCMALVLYAAYSTETGESKVFMANDQGNRMRLFKAPGRLRALHWLEHSQQAVLVDERGGLSTWARDMDGWSCQSTVRIPGLAAITVSGCLHGPLRDGKRMRAEGGAWDEGVRCNASPPD